MTDRTSPRFSVVIPVKNKRTMVEASVRSVLVAAAAVRAEVLLVDNGSTDGTLELLRSLASDRLVRFDGATVGAVRNFGSMRTTGDYLVFIDSDVVVPQTYFTKAIEILAKAQADAIGSEYGLPERPNWIEAAWHQLNVRGTDGYRDYINGGNFIVRRAAFEAIGGFDERLKAGEDTDLCRRLVVAGYRIFESQELPVVHLGNPKSIAQFFRQQIWHGLGVPSSQGRLIANKPMAMAALHAALLVVAALLLITRTPADPGARAAAACVAVLVVPIAAFAYRVRQIRRLVSPWKAVLLFEVYFLARAIAMVRLGRQRWRRPEEAGSMRADN